MLIPLVQVSFPHHVKFICQFDHLTVNCQVGSPLALDVSESVNYAKNFNPGLSNDHSLTLIILVQGITVISPIVLMSLLCLK